LEVLTVDWVAMVADCSGIYADPLDAKPVVLTANACAKQIG
jgi:hypothetical protein